MADLDWQDDAACKGYTKIFFPSRGSGTKDVLLAKKFCNICPVFDECHAWALTISGSDQGIYAGMSTRERRRLRRQLGLSKARERPTGYEYGRPRDDY